MAPGILTYLEQAAEYSPSKGFVFYSVGKDQPETILYPDFWRLVKVTSTRISTMSPSRWFHVCFADRIILSVMLKL